MTTLLTGTRQFSDFPAWADAHADRLAGKRILMFCTGGVRCERASAYVRGKGAAFADVHQLQGGIARYLEALPATAGGYFAGSNFVFDARMVQGAGDAAPTAVFGTCAVCASPTDDYAPQVRCRCCRMLVLVCPSCGDSRRGRSAAAAVSQAHGTPSTSCVVSSPSVSSVAAVSSASSDDDAARTPDAAPPTVPRAAADVDADADLGVVCELCADRAAGVAVLRVVQGNDDGRGTVMEVAQPLVVKHRPGRRRRKQAAATHGAAAGVTSPLAVSS